MKTWQTKLEGCIPYPETYISLFIKGISGNRFICVSNYGFKIFALNEKNEYSIVSLESYYNEIREIYELDKDKFIFCSEKDCRGSLGAPPFNIFILDKIEIKEITKSEKEEKLKEINNPPPHFTRFDYAYDKEEKKIIEGKGQDIIKSLKYNCKYSTFFEYSTYYARHYFGGEIRLKNKYLLVGIDNNILLFDIFAGKQLKRYKILTEGNNNLFSEDAVIEKWNDNNDDEFFMKIKENIFLFRLTGENDLKIIANSYFNDNKKIKKNCSCCSLF
jgi:hypothetical protein